MNPPPVFFSAFGASRQCPFRRAVALGTLTLAAQFTLFARDIEFSKHNLSASSPGLLKSETKSEIRVFCHTPHSVKAKTPMWNHFDSGAVYIPYTSSTKKAAIGQPTGASKLCLSCHDGTVALSMVRKRSPGPGKQGQLPALPAGAARLGTDLSDDHPISLVYDSALVMANGQLKDPSTLTGAIRLDKQKQVQCTSCHTSHDNRYGKFLVQYNFASSLCVACHSQNRWDNSAHRTSNKTWNGVPPNPWPHTGEKTVMANGCENCHRPHAAGTKPRLLNFPGEEANCFPCHNGNVASKNLESDFDKVSTHPVNLTTGVHDPTESPSNPPRHVECADCHNPHAAASQAATAPQVSGALLGVAGISAAGTPVKQIANEYELCFRCHADNTTGRPARVERQFVELNTRLEFALAAASFHPVEIAGKNPNVPSLISPWTTSSLVYCSDCHNSDSGPGAGGTGAKGPHGSAYAPLLERRLELTDNQSENSTAYALCYKCHSRTSILGDQSFTSHRKHVVDAKTACTTCHDSHGATKTSHLINFNTMYVTKSSAGRMEFIDNGTYRGTCYLSCHGKDHNPLSY
jgi:predicted CXXCH cytochrome family protein